MKIKKITSRNRRDFNADLVCEKCGAVEENVSCYDDSYFHENVIPKMECKECGASGCSEIRKPRYPDGVQI